MTTGWTPAAPAQTPPQEVLVWCPVCGNAPATARYGDFCSRQCRAASLDYHNRREIEFDREIERGCAYSVGGYVHDKTYDRKYAKPWIRKGAKS